ncbi:MAG TPA: enoyl-CoA hydratase/isomerase family protein [Candidatus Sulfotelmatobacter sp.]|jgi:enoyl-CoA hydratase|nr:enoyl-CoA hydratase/isomerase family protein [Candidatus Sulfotelmatobacter sp.]
MKKRRRNELPVKEFRGKGLRWEWRDGVVELTLDHEPLNEIGTLLLGELEQFVAAIDTLAPITSACIITSARRGGFSVGGDLKELYNNAVKLPPKQRVAGLRTFIQRIHRVANAIDAAPFITVAAVHGLCMGGGLELALLCDLIVADKMARFGFPELRLGFIPGFGGIPRLRRGVGNGFIRDMLFTGRTVKAEAAHQAGLISHLAGEGYALEVARSMAQQITKFDAEARIAAKKFIKPIPYQELREEVELFCKLFNRPQVMESLRRFVESDDPMKHLPVAPRS